MAGEEEQALLHPQIIADWTAARAMNEYSSAVVYRCELFLLRYRLTYKTSNGLLAGFEVYVVVVGRSREARSDVG